jgi:glutamate formiminotransferase
MIPAARRPIYQCAINFSEGRDLTVVSEIVAAARAATVADHSSDPDHNRSVVTLLGDAPDVYAAVIASAEVAVRRIDMRTHTGIHPRIGAIDVVPIVPIRHGSRGSAVELARNIGGALADRLGLPIYLYEWSAQPGRRSELPKIRAGGFEALSESPLTGSRAPDLGPDTVHPTAGAVVIGARGPLVAYNVNLESTDISVARQIAADIRRDRSVFPELAGVRALGLYLARRDTAQVSINVTRPDLTTLVNVFRYIEEKANALGVGVHESEVIGLVTRAALGGTPDEIHWTGYRPEQILETWVPEE